jgi:predicted nucleic acid-binding protein
MILVDTSVLVNFFKGIENEKVNKLCNAISNGIPFGINAHIYLELIQGSRDMKEFSKLKDYLSSQRFYDLKEGVKSYEKAAFIYCKCRKEGITVRSTIDLIIVQTAIENKLYLLHDDRDFSQIAGIIPELKEY